jgi:DNA-binding NtrC family response regulator
VLQESEVRQVGGTGARRVDVQLVAATNVDLLAAIESKEFREDLYYRLNVVTVPLPPLRERLEDVPALLAHLVEKHCRSQRRDIVPISPAALSALLEHDWPGNVRELENVVQRALALCGDGSIESDHLPPNLRGSRRPPAAAPSGDGAKTASPTSRVGDGLSWTDELSFKEARKRAQNDFEVAYLERLLQLTDGNVSEAARRAGLDRSNFRRILNRLEIKH